jgi:hypothetical protein
MITGVGLATVTALQAQGPIINTVAPRSAWTMDLAKMKIPDGLASGKIFDQEFVLEAAKLNGGTLTLRQGKEFFADAQIIVFLFLKEGEAMAGKTFRIASATGLGRPHIHVSAKVKPGGRSERKSEAFVNKYAMVVEFGKSSGGQLPGKFYLCLPDKTQSVVAGNFSVEVFDSTHPLATESLISGEVSV